MIARREIVAKPPQTLNDLIAGDQALFDRIHDRLLALFLPQDAVQQDLVNHLALAERRISHWDPIGPALLMEIEHRPPLAGIASWARFMRLEDRLQRDWLDLAKQLVSIKAPRQRKAKRMLPRASTR